MNMKSRPVPFFLYWPVENVQFCINSGGRFSRSLTSFTYKLNHKIITDILRQITSLFPSELQAYLMFDSSRTNVLIKIFPLFCSCGMKSNWVILRTRGFTLWVIQHKGSLELSFVWYICFSLHLTDFMNKGGLHFYF